ncbi:serine protease inhibitor 2-like isoform X2 [Periplaneta americana]|uniref:serine protease inhibitor 2-like isoform X2 n=1 Tax=Periplaneta americana TaxID=6978 RepID=UPI0037E8112B
MCKVVLDSSLNIFLVVVVGIIWAAPKVQQNPDYDDDDVFTPVEGRENFDLFDWRLCKELAAKEPGNVVVSPVSVKLVLAMLYEGARGNTAQELEKALHLPTSRLKSREMFTQVLKSLETKHSDFVLDIGTKVFLRKGVKLDTTFSKILRYFYNTDFQDLDFTEPSEAVRTVNSWVTSATRGNIKSMFTEDMMESSTVMVLVNAIFFKGLWRYPFNKNNTVADKFRVTPTKSVETSYMHMENYFYYSESVELDSKIIRLPYMGEKYSMFIVLPKQPDGLGKLLKTVSPAILRNQFFHMQKLPVDVLLPRFRFDFTIKLEDALQTLGIKDVFSESSADLSGVVKDNKIFVSRFFQKAGLEVNEEGTTAFASTGTSIINRFGSDTDFYARHPFMFFIQDETTGTVIFVGKVVNPSTEKVQLRNHQKTPHIPPHGRFDNGSFRPDIPSSFEPHQVPFIAVPASNDVIDHDKPVISLKVWTYLYNVLLKTLQTKGVKSDDSEESLEKQI